MTEEVIDRMQDLSEEIPEVSDLFTENKVILEGYELAAASMCALSTGLFYGIKYGIQAARCVYEAAENTQDIVAPTIIAVLGMAVAVTSTYIAGETWKNNQLQP